MRRRGIYVVGILLTAAACVAVGWSLRSQFGPSMDTPTDAGEASRGDRGPNEQPDAERVGAASSIVRLPAEKIAAIGLQFDQVASRYIHEEHQVPGRLQYDDRRHVAVRSATAGVVTEILVNPGDTVAAGDVLVELNSAEIGLARADVLQRQAELQLATDHRNWLKSTNAGLEQLSEAIRKRVPVEEIRRSFQDIRIGRSREPLLSAYSDLLLAESLVTAAQQSARSGALSGRTLEERMNQRANSEATLLSALEGRSYEAGQEIRSADAQVQDADRRLRVSQQNVRTLLGRSSNPDNAASGSDAEDSEADLQPDSLSIVRLKAPFAGTIERRLYSRSERVDAGDSLLVLADTSTLWVAADLREREWNALSLKPGDQVMVKVLVPGLDTVSATVHFVGREVDAKTNAVPLVAVIDNADGRLRPGMFVQVAVPVTAPREALVVPESAVLEHNQQAFVFLQESTDQFRRVGVVPGLRMSGFVEVLSGLTRGQRVVSSGGFSLKSELLLQGELAE